MEDQEFDYDQDPEQAYLHARQQATGEITAYAVNFLEYYSQHMGKNVALGIAIEAMSESLGNLISLVKDEFQDEVIGTAHQVMLQGILAQQKMIAEIAYGQVGTA